MIRVILCFLFCMLMFPTRIIAAEVGGYIYIKADVDKKSTLTVAYTRYHPRYTQGSIFGNCSYGNDNFSGKSKLFLTIPNALVVWPQDKPCVYRCINLKPGFYKICAKLGNYIATKTINVPSEDSSISMNFSINTKSTGTLEVLLPSDVMHNISVWPAWNTNKFDWKKEKNCPEAIGIWARSNLGDKKIVFDGLCDGKYKVVLYETGIKYDVYRGKCKDKFLKLWIVEIKEGYVTSIKAK